MVDGPLTTWMVCKVLLQLGVEGVGYWLLVIGPPAVGRLLVVGLRTNDHLHGLLGWAAIGD